VLALVAVVYTSLTYYRFISPLLYSELNPEVMEEMARLRNENIHLKAFAEAREDDAVQMLGERLEDSQRLSDRYKEQFLSTKNELEQTEQKLQGSQEHVSQLKDQVQDLSGNLEQLGQELENCKVQLSSTQENLTNTSQLLQESKEREESLRGDLEKLTQELSDANDLAAHRLHELESTKTELEETMASLQNSQVQEQQLHKEVAEWAEKTAAAENAFSECESQLAETKGVLEKESASLVAALEREAVLKDSVANLETTNRELQDKIEEGIRSTEAALFAAETELHETRCELEEKAILELEKVKETMNAVLDAERATLEQKLAEASEEYSQLEEKAAADLAQLEEKYKQDLQRAMDESQQAQEQLREKYEHQIVAAEKTAVEEREKLIKKGKGMLKESKDRAKEELADVEDQLQEVEAELSNLRQRFEAYETQAKKQIREYKKRMRDATTRINGLAQSNDILEDSIRDLERERLKLQEENERFRRELGGRFGADGKVMNQLELLSAEFDVVLEENRGLKKEIEKMRDPHSGGLSSISELAETEGNHSSYTRGGVSGSTLTQFRKEYEDEIAALKDTAREHVMKTSAAITEVQKAEHRAYESDKQVQTLREEIISLKLKLQRLQQTSEGSGEYHDAICEQFDQSFTKKNALSQETPGPYDSKPQATSQSSTMKEGPFAVHSTSDEMLLDLSCSNDKAMPLSESTNDNRYVQKASKPKVDAHDFPPAHQVKKQASPVNKVDLLKPVPSLMDHVMSSQNSAPDDAQPECKQS